MICLQVDEFNVSHVFTVFMLRRSDKRKDRVEISPEQLSHASTQAEISFFVTKRHAAPSTVTLFREIVRMLSKILFTRCRYEGKIK